jgi:hypothetical protein
MDPTANGFQNLATTLKYRVFKSPKHEFVLSAGLSVEWGGTGSSTGGAKAFNTYMPTVHFGKGVGDLRYTLSRISRSRSPARSATRFRPETSP